MFIRNRMFASYSPRLRYITDAETVEATTAAAAAAAAAATPPTDLGFPADTALAEMTDAQRAAYWKHHSRRHEATASARADYDALKADSVALAALRAANLTDDEKKLDEARRDGENLGAQRYLMDAVTSRLLHLTGKTDEEIAAAIDLIDVTKLTLTDGNLDIPKITAFAGTLGTKAPATPAVPPTDPVKDVFGRTSTSSTPQSTGSLAELTKERAAALTKPLNATK